MLRVRATIALLILTLLLMGCASGSPASSNPCPAGNTVQTGSNYFEQSCVTLSKGGTLTIVQDQTSYHILDYGAWNGSTAAPQAPPPGAPALQDLTMGGSSINLGPFNTAGTYTIYCTVHPGMELTIIVV